MRNAYGEVLVEIGRANPDVVVLNADLSEATKTSIFDKVFPERFFNIGIAEQNMVGIAAGLATCGKISFATTLAVFITMRACEQVRTSVALPNLNVKTVGFYGGLCTAQNGPTHQCIADINMMRGLPNMTVLAPSDASACKACVRWAAEYQGPVYIRGLRDGEPVIYDEKVPLDVTRAQVHRRGKDAAIIANGFMVHRAIEAAEILASKGINVTVLDIMMIKPLDCQTLLEVASDVECVVTVEEHNIYGGLGSAVAEVLIQKHPLPMKIMGVPDVFSGSDTYRALLEKINLTAGGIVNEVKKLRKQKGKNTKISAVTGGW